MDKKIILTIGRQYGSGGRDIGRILSQELGITLWDKELLMEAAQESGINEKLMEQYDEKPTSSFLYSLVMGMQAGQGLAGEYNVPLPEKACLAQFETLQKIAETQSGIFVGRCADYALRDCEERLSVFIYAPLEARIARVAERRGITPEEAENRIAKTDKQRSSYYGHYTLQKWGDMNNYHLCIDSSVLGIEKTAALIRTMLEQRG